MAAECSGDPVNSCDIGDRLQIYDMVDVFVSSMYLAAEDILRCCGQTRDPHWDALAKEWKRLHPTCAACGESREIQVHHKVPFHIDRSKELDFNNLISLCGPTHHCHLIFGHLWYWQKYNEFVEEDAVHQLLRVQQANERSLCGQG